MNRHDRSHEDENLMAKLNEALGDDPRREPPPDRVAAIRAAAEELRRGRAQNEPPTPVFPAPSSPAAPDDDSGGQVVRFPGRRKVLLGGVAAATLGFVAGAGGGELLRRSGAPAVEPIAFGGAPPAVQAAAGLINHTWGTELMLDVAGLDDGETYQIVYRTEDAGPTGAGSFQSVANTVVRCRCTAAPLREDLVAIAVLDGAGAEVMRAQLA